MNALSRILPVAMQKFMFALTYSLTGYAKNDHLGRR
jgi:hypothetical protein